MSEGISFSRRGFLRAAVVAPVVGPAMAAGGGASSASALLATFLEIEPATFIASSNWSEGMTYEPGQFVSRNMGSVGDLPRRVHCLDPAPFPTDDPEEADERAEFARWMPDFVARAESFA